jgi:hypothetical protein
LSAGEIDGVRMGGKTRRVAKKKGIEVIAGNIRRDREIGLLGIQRDCLGNCRRTTNG